MERKLLIIILLFASIFNVQAKDDALQTLLEHPSLKHVSVGISVKSLKTGETLFEHRSEKSMQPASVVKIFTTGLALEKCGKDFRYKTIVSYSDTIVDGVLKGDLIIEASGDPTANSRFFPNYNLVKKIDDALLQARITTIEGRIRVLPQETLARLPGSWVWEDLSNHYAAPYRTFNYRDNAYILGLATGRAGGPSRVKSVDPPLPGKTFISNAIASRQPKDDAWIFGGPYSDTLYVEGTLPQNQAAYAIKGALYSPAACFVGELSTRLTARKVVINNKIINDLKHTTLLQYTSPSLEEIVLCTNKWSVNLFSEALGVLVDSVDFAGALKNALQRIGASPSGIIMKDACGLSAYSAVPPVALADFLIWAYNAVGKAFTHSLPVAGIDGNLTNYVSGNPLLKNKLFAKTGTFTGVRCLAGYITAKSGEQYAFCIMLNHCVENIHEVQNQVGHFLSKLAAL
ncbi:D-alanyl-D-alanine carboxypeptidase [Bacteroidia bacterium]|nr:D-alanyl-D-alanine carboxypeptidase [Bacteroidia bacterium]